MRRELIEALSYPKLLVQKKIEARSCPHDGKFDSTDEQCHDCDVDQECHWVACLKEFDDFDGKANHTINASLRYGIKLVGKMHGELRHDETACKCEACIWVRESQSLTEAFDARFLVKPYRQMD
jgi:hypothetical protein